MKHCKKTSTYIDLLKEYNAHTNIYSAKAYDKLDFHIEDSKNIASLIPDTPNISILDLGSGSGLPSIPIAIANPNNHIIAIDSKSKKTTFLSSVKHALALTNLTVINSNINDVIPTLSREIDFITAKAFAPYEKIKKIIGRLNQNKKTTLIIPISKNQFDILNNLTDKTFSLLTHENKKHLYLIEQLHYNN